MSSVIGFRVSRTACLPRISTASSMPHLKFTSQLLGAGWTTHSREYMFLVTELTSTAFNFKFMTLSLGQHYDDAVNTQSS